MLTVRSLVAAAGALIAMPLMGSPAWSDACVSAPVSTYTAAGFSCSDGSLTFSDIAVTSSVLGGPLFASLTLGGISPLPERAAVGGLQLAFFARAFGPGAVNIDWSYDVSSTIPLSDAFLQVFGTAIPGFPPLLPNSIVLATQQLSNGVLLQVTVRGLTGPSEGTGTSADLPTPVSSLRVTNGLFVGGGGLGATSSGLQNAFIPVPAPLAGAGLPGLIAALGGLVAMARRRRRQLA